MKTKLKKLLIISLSFLEVILLTLLLNDEPKNCLVKSNKNELLVYNYSNTLLSPIYKEEIINVTAEEKNDESIEESNIKKEDNEIQIEETVYVEPLNIEPVYAEQIYEEPVAIHDVNFSVAESLVEYAKQFVGYPYVYGGNSLTMGTDCSGFTKLIYAEYGIDLPRVAYDQQFVGYEVPLSQIQIGDLVLSGYEGKTHHVSIYIGNGQLVHALNSSVGIVITDLYIMPITHVRRVL